ncbi:MAG: FIST C-terminal domain-containing protein [Acidimicrobiia bacterium]|nr:FIST C-terminal domain-containing protein [Acidimicrobiia bacterium]
MRRFAAAASEHPLASHAAGEVIGEVMDQLGRGPDLAVLFATGDHTGVFEELAYAVDELLAPQVLIGCTAASVLAGPQELEETPAVSLFAGRVGAVAPVRLDVVESPDGTVVVGMPDEAVDARTLVLLADPFSFPGDDFLTALAVQYPGLRAIGGLASAARDPGGNRLLVGRSIHDDGAVGVLLDSSMPVDLVVSQGCRPVGQPFVVTRAERNVIYELGGQPALDRLQHLLDETEGDERRLLAQGLHIGIVVDEQQEAFDQGDFLIRAVLGVDRSVGAVAVGEQVPVGSIVQFQVRDAQTADDDLRHLLAGGAAEGALVFTCNGRGERFFDEPHHDAELVHAVAGDATAGLFCAGEIGPIGMRNATHGYTASVLLFGGDRDAGQNDTRGGADR